MEPHRLWEVFGTVEYTSEMLRALESMPMVRVDRPPITIADLTSCPLGDGERNDE